MTTPTPLACQLLPGLIASLVLAAALQALAAPPEPDAGLVAWYRLDATDTFGEDASGHAHRAQVTGATACPGRVEGGALLDGDGGLQISNTPLLQAAGGFTIECSLRFSDVSQNMNIASKEGEYLLRVDPPPEGGQISFFVHAQGSLEPRVRGPVAQPDVWYHIVATWDGYEAALWVNGQQFTQRRPGQVVATESPVLIGKPSQWGPVGLKGTLDEVRLYSRALSAGDVLIKEYGLDGAPQGPTLAQTEFEFEADAQGWQGREADRVMAPGGRLVATTRGGESVLLRTGLDAPIRGKRYAALRMAVSRGEAGRLLLLTTAGLRNIPFDIKADGEMHSYVFDTSRYPEWLGGLRAVGIVPSDAAAEVAVDFLRISEEAQAPPEVSVDGFLPDRVVNRAGKPCTIMASVTNTGGDTERLTAQLVCPRGVRVLDGARRELSPVAHNQVTDLSWEVQADEPGPAELTLQVTAPEMAPAVARLKMEFATPVSRAKADYVPEPSIPKSEYLIGAHYCPLWKQGSRSSGWELIEPYPERKPALGWYDEDDPEVTDWELKWALEHGINYFVYCWYRRNQGHGVEMFLSHAIHDGLFNSRYGDKFKFTIMWENQFKGHAGVASEEDLLQNLLPFWIEKYFKHPSYLKIDNKPLLFIYRPEFLVDDLGSIANVKSAMEKMRQACRDAGFDGLTILGEYRGADPRPLQKMVDEGLDYSFAYCWPVGGHPDADRAIRTQEEFWTKREQMAVIPDLVTISMGWDSTPWHPSSSIWRLSPDEFRDLCGRAKAFMDELPADHLGRRLALLDNWNEFGEGHYIAPHRQYGFGYLDAVRDVFTDADPQHVDLVPEDVGLGPYDSRFREMRQRQAEAARKVLADDGLEPGLIGWWTFDEEQGAAFAWDWSGNGLGGIVDKATRAPGLRGQALVCSGGCVAVPGAGEHFALDEITVECWVKTDLAGQSDKWFVTNLYSAGAAGFRLGLSDGRLCWAVPKTAWSHHVAADKSLPLGQWVHVAATYDGEMMRLYMDGVQIAQLARFGRVHPNRHALTLGSYARNHTAHFTGLLDEVRIISRALSADEIASRARRE